MATQSIILIHDIVINTTTINMLFFCLFLSVDVFLLILYEVYDHSYKRKREEEKYMIITTEQMKKIEGCILLDEGSLLVDLLISRIIIFILVKRE